MILLRHINRLIQLNLLPLRYQYELNDLLFLLNPIRLLVITLTCMNLSNLDPHLPDHQQLLNLFTRFLFLIQIVTFIFVKYQDFGMLYLK